MMAEINNNLILLNFEKEKLNFSMVENYIQLNNLDNFFHDPLSMYIEFFFNAAEEDFTNMTLSLKLWNHIKKRSFIIHSFANSIQCLIENIILSLIELSKSNGKYCSNIMTVDVGNFHIDSYLRLVLDEFFDKYIEYEYDFKDFKPKRKPITNPEAKQLCEFLHKNKETEMYIICNDIIEINLRANNSNKKIKLFSKNHNIVQKLFLVATAFILCCDKLENLSSLRIN